MATLTDLLHSHHELRAALRTAISEIERLQFGRKDPELLRLLRGVLADGRAVAAQVASAAGSHDADEEDAFAPGEPVAHEA
jgi:hypothetical protein